MGACLTGSIVPLTGGEYTPIQSWSEGEATPSQDTVIQIPDPSSVDGLTDKVTVESVCVCVCKK